LIYPLNRPNKNENFLEKKKSFLFGLLGGKSKQKYFTGGKSKKNILQGEKPEMTYITGGKDLLTLLFNTSFIFTKLLSA